jgi:hypothetical protein
MKTVNYSILFFSILLFSVSLFAVDASWVTSITYTPAALTAGTPATVQASFRVNGDGGIDNLRVIGGIIGGERPFDRTWAHIENGATRTASFTGTPSDPGTFTIFFQIDPDNTSPDSDRTNNTIEILVTVAPSPTNVSVGRIELVSATRVSRLKVDANFQAHFTVHDSTARNFKVIAGTLGLHGEVFYERVYESLEPGNYVANFTIRDMRKGHALIYISVDPDNTLAENNEADNYKRSLLRISEKGGPIPLE